MSEAHFIEDNKMNHHTNISDTSDQINIYKYKTEQLKINGVELKYNIFNYAIIYGSIQS